MLFLSCVMHCELAGHGGLVLQAARSKLMQQITPLCHPVQGALHLKRQPHTLGDLEAVQNSTHNGVLALGLMGVAVLGRCGL